MVSKGKKLVFCAFLLLTTHLWAIDWTTPPTNISGSGDTLPSSEVAVDSNGNGVAIWVNDTDKSIEAAVFTAATNSWSSPVAISTSVGITLSHEHVKVDSSGNAVAVWMDTNGIRSNTLPQGGSWTGVTTIEAVAVSAPDADLALAVNTAHQFVAIWTPSFTADLKGAALAWGGSWSTPATIAPAGVSNTYASLSLVVDSLGNGVAVFVNNPVNQYEVLSSTYNGTSWGPLLTVLPIESVGVFPQNISTAIDHSDQTITVYWDINDQALKASQLATGSSSWTSLGAVSSGSVTSAPRPRVVFCANGTAVVAWQQTDGVNIRIKAATFSGSSWSTAQNISAAGADATLVRLSADTIGDVFAVWQRNGYIQAADLHCGGSWSNPTTISTGGSGSDSFVASGGAAKVIAIWNESNVIQASTSGIVAPHASRSPQSFHFSSAIERT